MTNIVEQQTHIPGPVSLEQARREAELKAAAAVGRTGLTPDQSANVVEVARDKSWCAVDEGNLSEALDWQAVASGFESPQG